MDRRFRRYHAAAVAVLVLLLVTACAPDANPAAAGPDPAGFWLGLWHGVIMPVTFVVSLFNERVGMYEVRNSGGWYDFGFLLGIMLTWAGGGASARRR